MNDIKVCILGLMLLGLAACSTTGGTIGGLLPAPKFTQGKIENDTYFSKDNEFSIALPHRKGSSEYIYMQIKEQYSDIGTYVSFGPAAVDRSIYRVEIGRKLSPQSKTISFENYTNLIVSSYIKRLESGYKSKITQIKKDKLNINGLSSYHVELLQAGNTQSVKHQIYVCDFPEMGVIFWVQTPSSGVNETEVTALDFAKSFKLIAKNTEHTVKDSQ